MPESAAGKPVEIWFQDEARVGQKGSLEYIWAPVGSRPPMVRDNRHDSAYLFGAICHARQVGAAIIMPTVNAEAMSEHLREISAQVTPGAHAVVVCDGAGWHQQGKRLRVPDNITLLPLPPYSPELNPMENIRDYLRGSKLSRRVWQSYEAIVAACKEAWLVSPTSSFLRTKSFGVKGIVFLLVTIGGLRPGVFRSDDVRGEAEVSIDPLDVWIGSCGLSDAQRRAVVGGQDDGADLMGLEDVAQARPGGVDGLVEQGFFDGDEQMVCQDAKKDMSVGAGLEVVEDRSYGERRFHVAEGIFGAGKQGVDAPELIG